jgi:hypothetical protein
MPIFCAADLVKEVQLSKSFAARSSGTFIYIFPGVSFFLLFAPCTRSAFQSFLAHPNAMNESKLPPDSLLTRFYARRDELAARRFAREAKRKAKQEAARKAKMSRLYLVSVTQGDAESRKVTVLHRASTMLEPCTGPIQLSIDFGEHSTNAREHSLSVVLRSTTKPLRNGSKPRRLAGGCLLYRLPRPREKMD